MHTNETQKLINKTLLSPATDLFLITHPIIIAAIDKMVDKLDKITQDTPQTLNTSQRLHMRFKLILSCLITKRSPQSYDTQTKLHRLLQKTTTAKALSEIIDGKSIFNPYKRKERELVTKTNQSLTRSLRVI